MRKYLVCFGLILYTNVVFAQNSNDYSAVSAVANSCYFSFGDHEQLGKSLVLQTMILSSTRPKSVPLSGYSENDIVGVDQEANQSYLNNTLYKIRLFNWIYSRQNNLLTQLTASKDPHVILALQISSTLFESEKNNIQILTEDDKQQLGILVNRIHRTMNQVCQKHHAIYKVLMSKYGSQAYEVSSAFAKPMIEEQEKGASEANVFETMVMHTPLSYMLGTETDLQDEVGTYDPEQCVTKGKQFSMIKSTKVINDSIPQVEQKYRDLLSKIAPPNTLLRALQSSREENTDSKKLLRSILQKRPQSVENALLKTSSANQAKAVCSVIHDMQDRYTANEILMPVAVVGSTVITLVSGPAAPLVGGIFSAIFVGINAKDLIHSYRNEKSIEQALLASQISPIYAQYMIADLRNERPWSYANLVLAGLGTAASALRIVQLSKTTLEVRSGPPLSDMWVAKTDIWTFQSETFEPDLYQPTNPVDNSPIRTHVIDKIKSSGVFTPTQLSEFVSDKPGGSIGSLKDFHSANTEKFSLSSLSQNSWLPTIQARSNSQTFPVLSTTPHVLPKHREENPQTTKLYHENDSDFVKLQKALSDDPDYQAWIKERAEECINGEGRFSPGLCKLIVDFVSGKFDDKKGLVMVFNHEDTILNQLKGSLDTMYIAFKLANGKYLIVIAAMDHSIKFHVQIYDEIIKELGDLEFINAGTIIYMRGHCATQVSGKTITNKHQDLVAKDFSDDEMQDFRQSIIDYFVTYKPKTN